MENLVFIQQLLIYLTLVIGFYAFMVTANFLNIVLMLFGSALIFYYENILLILKDQEYINFSLTGLIICIFLYLLRDAATDLSLFKEFNPFRTKKKKKLKK